MSKTIKLAALSVITIALSQAVHAECTTNRNADVQITKPDNQYTDHGDGTVTDNKTGLMWQKCSLGQTYNAGACDSAATTMTWQQALTAANDNTLYGYNDWVLPNVTQLNSLVDDACYSPNINETLFPSTVTGAYWSSSPYANTNNYAWRVFFNSGLFSGSHKYMTYAVRLVRASN